MHGLGLRGDAVRDGHLEAVLRGVDADVDVGGLPPVGGIDVVGAGRRRADEVGHRAHQDVVARPRPGLVGEQHEVRVERRVVEEVQRRPALLRRDAVAVELAVEVLRAVDVARVAEVLVVARGAGEGERVVAADRVLHDLAQRVHVGVEVLRVQADGRVRGAHQRARDLRVQAALDPLVELVGVEGEEVRALAARDVDDLDELALAHLVGERARLVHAEVEPRLGERRRQLGLRARRDLGADQLDDERGRRPVAVDHAAAGRGDDEHRVAAGGELLARAGRPVGAEQADRPRVLAGQLAADEHARRRVRARPEHLRVRAEHDDLRRLPAVRVDDRDAVAAADAHARRAARPHPPRLEGRVDGLQAGGEQRRAGGDGHDR